MQKITLGVLLTASAVFANPTMVSANADIAQAPQAIEASQQQNTVGKDLLAINKGLFEAAHDYDMAVFEFSVNPYSHNSIENVKNSSKEFVQASIDAWQDHKSAVEPMLSQDQDLAISVSYQGDEYNRMAREVNNIQKSLENTANDITQKTGDEIVQGTGVYMELAQAAYLEKKDTQGIFKPRTTFAQKVLDIRSKLKTTFGKEATAEVKTNTAVDEVDTSKIIETDLSPVKKMANEVTDAMKGLLFKL